jgi:hypothetical protein
MDKELFKRDPREYAISLALDEEVDASFILTCCLKYMSQDDIRKMLDVSELSPKFWD